MYNYNCPDCNEAKLQSDKNARKINEVIDQVNALIQVNNETVDFIEEKAKEVVGEIAEIKVNENIGDIKTSLDNIEKGLNSMIFDGNIMVSHRGGSYYAPENTIASFDVALKQGYKAIETDVLLTSNNEWIVFHDSTLERMTNGEGKVNTKTLSELKRLIIDGGYNVNRFAAQKILTLNELFDYVKGNKIYLLLEIKVTTTLDNLKTLVNKIYDYELENNIILLGYSVENFENIRTFDKYLKCSIALDTDITETHIGWANYVGNCGFTPYVKNLTKTGVELAHDNNYFVMPYDVKTYGEVLKCKEYQVDGMVCDCISEVNINASYLL